MIIHNSAEGGDGWSTVTVGEGSEIVYDESDPPKRWSVNPAAPGALFYDGQRVGSVSNPTAPAGHAFHVAWEMAGWLNSSELTPEDVFPDHA